MIVLGWDVDCCEPRVDGALNILFRLVINAKPGFLFT